MPSSKKTISISIVIPVYNEEGNLLELYKRLTQSLKESNVYELIFINDCSTDSSLQILFTLSQEDNRIKIIDFSRNFGHQIALTAGLDHANNDVAITLDADLQDTPEIIPQMINKWSEGYDVVHAKRRKRDDTLFKRSTAFLFYRLLNHFSATTIPQDVGDFRLLDKKIVKEMRKFKEHARFIRGLTSWVGFKQTVILFNREKRANGHSHYSLTKMFRLAFDALTSFSTIPLKIASYIGFLCALTGFGIGIYYIILKIIDPTTSAQGWTTTMAVIFFIGGIQLIILGIIGEYIGRIYTESQDRPLYIIKQRINLRKQ